MTKPQYEWAPGSHFASVVKAEVAGPILKRIIGRRGNNADAVLNEACNPESPLHQAFEWDDAAAAHEHRLETARLMLRSIRYHVKITPNGDSKPVRTVVAIRALPPEERYQHRDVVMKDAKKRDMLAEQCARELIGFAARNADLWGHELLRGVFREIDRLRTRLS